MLSININLGGGEADLVSIVRDTWIILSPLVSIAALYASVALPLRYRRSDRRARATALAVYVSARLTEYVKGGLAALVNASNDYLVDGKPFKFPEECIPPDFSGLKDIADLDVTTQVSLMSLTAPWTLPNKLAGDGLGEEPDDEQVALLVSFICTALALGINAYVRLRKAYNLPDIGALEPEDYEAPAKLEEGIVAAIERRSKSSTMNAAPASQPPT